MGSEMCIRDSYHSWEQENGERYRFVKKLEKEFPEYEASCGGEISIDIVPVGWNKSVVKREVLNKFPGSELIFFGDRMGPQGNDQPLAEVLDTPSGKHRAIPVESYKDTWMHLKNFALSKVHAKMQDPQVTSSNEKRYATVH